MKEKIALFFGFRKGGISFDKYSLHAVLLGLLLIILFTVYEIYILEKSYTLAWSGAVIFLFGAIIRITARLQLGKLFTFNVKIMHDHKLKTDGLYTYMRHPGYTGLLIEVIGWCVFFQSWLAALATILFLIPAGYYRIKVEEQTLEINFPEYKEYKKKTKALIPYIF